MQDQLNEICQNQRREYIQLELEKFKLEFNNLLTTEIANLKQEIQTKLYENRDLDRQEYVYLKQQQGHAVDELKNSLMTDMTRMGQDMQAMVNENRDSDRQMYTHLKGNLANARIEFQYFVRTSNNTQRQEKEAMLGDHHQSQRQEFTVIRNRIQNNQSLMSQRLFEARNTIPPLRTDVELNEQRTNALRRRMDAIGEEARDVVRRANGHDIIVCNEYIKQ